VTMPPWGWMVVLRKNIGGYVGRSPGDGRMGVRLGECREVVIQAPGVGEGRVG
jgi:hypothetical protein